LKGSGELNSPATPGRLYGISDHLERNWDFIVLFFNALQRLHDFFVKYSKKSLQYSPFISIIVMCDVSLFRKYVTIYHVFAVGDTGATATR